MCYSTDRADQFRTAASYVDRMLRGTKPADLPVQAPTKYQTVVNLKTASALGLTVPTALLVAADEVIEWDALDSRAEQALPKFHSQFRQQHCRG
jgi:ABC-type uncharacterized transport system substrate-binding protein